MFGWEFPPHISGGLGTACFGLSQSLAKKNTHVLFVAPRADDHQTLDGVAVISASNIPVPIKAIEKYFPVIASSENITGKRKEHSSKLTSITITSDLLPYFYGDSIFTQASLEQWNYQLNDNADTEHIKMKDKTQTRYLFSGGYGSHLLEEVKRYAMVAGQIAKKNSFDVIHAHDWLTYPAGLEAKRISGKPLIIHVHATEYDRGGENINQRIFEIEQNGMEQADRIIAVSQLTKNIIISRYNIAPTKVDVVHNGVAPKKNNNGIALPPIGKRIVTFLGRVTCQKGPGYFVDAAYKVLQKFPDVHFVMAGSGDLLPKMIERVAALKLSSHFHFTGFLNTSKVDKIWAISTVYVMPSVSEPFGIAPLEAIMAGVPVIISNQSGVAEVVQHAIKVNFWDTQALASAICDLLTYKSLTNTLKRKSEVEIKKINWSLAAKKINTIYHELTTQP